MGIIAFYSVVVGAMVASRLNGGGFAVEGSRARLGRAVAEDGGPTSNVIVRHGGKVSFRLSRIEARGVGVQFTGCGWVRVGR